MRLEVLLLNKTKESYLKQGVADYLHRLRRYVPVELVEITVKNLTSRSDSEIKAKESAQLDRRAAKGSYRIALDSHGQQLSSEKFASLLTELENRAVKSVSFIIGGPLGLAAEQLHQADRILSLSAMTFTHDMTRLILLEQIYRAYTIKAGTSYHK
ncbi:MAG: 23S rRNA (pseudouridine(1915)-N(3))-methyltransferase RlmH [Desulfofustis sp.]|nr:23S rRNA (pseudouridine(1915)-N(3))-methyltransferase RlmH [Desulfofustis sp.]NNF47969.1 23S rRNA (pseudouridine(1915)-N(3))-methyltransferase RlmH [Desulfofustis sp.]NNK57761.1 23S rRNA (pseudouridine(1915)-N(3))-methyltransferase RlmH [Desulfofustis sp.]